MPDTLITTQTAAADGWQTIDTAPTDGTIIQLWSAHAPKVGVVAGAYDVQADMPWRFVEYIDWNTGKEDEDADPFNAFLKRPTHWKPLSTPPSTES